MRTVTCDICGTAFETRQGTKKRCGPECVAVANAARTANWKRDNPERVRELAARHRSKPETKARNAEYRARPEVKARKRELANTPDARAMMAAYRARPDVKARRAQIQLERYYRNGREKVDHWLFGRLLFMQDYTCLRCLEPFTAHTRGQAVQLDHVVPTSRGGRHEPSNWQVLCERCNGNGGKGHHTVDYRPEWMRRDLIELQARIA